MEKPTFTWHRNACCHFLLHYNSANQHTRITHADGSYWVYQYDLLGQVTSGKHYWADGTPVAGQQFEYGFDDIGNRKTAAHGGNASGSNLRVETYTANALNQYTARTVPGFAEVQGRASADATVTVNLQATTRQGPYWRYEQAVNNASSSVLVGLTNVAVLRGAGAGGTDLVASNTGSLFLPQTPETYLHDADGNLTRDGRWTNYWDGENRLIRTESLEVEPSLHNSSFIIHNFRVRQDWLFLPDGRWAQRVIYSWSDNAWTATATHRFLWDDKVLLAVLNGSNQPEQTYLRGSDLSGTMQGAGGVGGLLAICYLQSQIHLAAFDGNGNVSALMDADTGAESARYEYDPFGNTLRATGPAARANSLRFSTQFADEVTGRVKYLYRDYDAGTGRWLSRDPLEELSGNNNYSIVGNDTPNKSDLFGLVEISFRKNSKETGLGFFASGEWSQPAWYGDGKYTETATSMESWVHIWSGPTPAGSCNSISGSLPLPGGGGATTDSNAGAFYVYARNECGPGRFRLFFNFDFNITTKGRFGYGMATLWWYGKSPSYVTSITGGAGTLSNSFGTFFDIDLDKNKKLVITYDPFLNFPTTPTIMDSEGEVRWKVSYAGFTKI